MHIFRFIRFLFNFCINLFYLLFICIPLAMNKYSGFHKQMQYIKFYMIQFWIMKLFVSFRSLLSTITQIWVGDVRLERPCREKRSSWNKRIWKFPFRFPLYPSFLWRSRNVEPLSPSRIQENQPFSWFYTRSTSSYNEVTIIDYRNRVELPLRIVGFINEIFWKSNTFRLRI